jgi:hypothetical protein
MKTLIFSLRIGLFFLAIIALFSCEKSKNDYGIGTAEFAVSSPDEVIGSKSASSGDSAYVSYQILFSVEDSQGNPVFTDELIPLYMFGTSFVSENVEIMSGNYSLTKFMVINPEGKVVLAAPLEGSPLAYLVDNPLPMEFTIKANEVTRITPQVLVVGYNPPEQFGYLSFGIQIIKPLDFWAVCYIDNPFIDAIPQPVTARLTIHANNGWHYTFNLEATVNHLIIRGGSETYIFILEKEGYKPQEMQFTARELRATTREYPLILTIPYSSQYYKLVLQPGPRKGRDAMISNLAADKNFGDHRYFEATYLSEPVLTVMRSNRSLISFDLDTLPKSAIIKKVLLTLWYDIPIPFDTEYLNYTDPSPGVVWYGAVLQKIIEPWEEYKVTWNTQPGTVETGQVYLSPFIRNCNMIQLNVTSLFIPSDITVSNVWYPNYGIFFRLWPTERFPGFRFASSDYPVPYMRPELTIYYTLP